MNMSGRPSKRTSDVLETEMQQPAKKRTKLSINEMIEILGALKNARRGILSSKEELTILHTYYSLKLQDAVDRQNGIKIKPGNFQNRVAEMLGYSIQSISRVYKKFNDRWRQGQFATTPEAKCEKRHSSGRPERIYTNKGVLMDVRKFITECRCNMDTVTAVNVMDYMIDKGFIEVTYNAVGLVDKKSRAAALRAVQRWLLRHGFSREKGKGRYSIFEKEKLRVQLETYLFRVMENRVYALDQKRKREVYIGESYCPHHYNYYVHHVSTVDDWNNEPTRNTKITKGAAKYVFAAGIIGDNPHDSTDKAKYLARTLKCIPVDDAKEDSNGDSHNGFGVDMFYQWFKEQVLPSLEGLDRNSQGEKKGCLIIMDHAKYRRARDPSEPNPSRFRRAQLLAYLEERGIDTSRSQSRIPPTCMMLRAKAMEWYRNNVELYVVKLAREAGHEVVFVPPHHNDLQPMELVWAHTKRQVARQYTPDTSFDVVGKRLESAFHKLEGEAYLVGEMIRHTRWMEQTLYNAIRREESDVSEHMMEVVGHEASRIHLPLSSSPSHHSDVCSTEGQHGSHASPVSCKEQMTILMCEFMQNPEESEVDIDSDDEDWYEE